MKTQITYRKLDGGEGVALVNGGISELHQAKQDLANWLDLPETDSSAADHEDVDGRLRRGGIEPGSVRFNHISE
ncbi:hypothetical protein [Achromobacter sp. NFACC18-2]|uniref:hypothetical protein n=1 Tax=Achromobacter sp. NFACC18-2 TaxID=1564112 RepID=UPI0008C3C3A8|nr:hypothetical protein [Achromobacter sp. NFACC18-2]SEK00180.1 hypothetical protein SAMN03159494_04275 [Achromobacter sp. NFACC18-2]